jgi:hypothetical protein
MPREANAISAPGACRPFEGRRAGVHPQKTVGDMVVHWQFSEGWPYRWFKRDCPCPLAAAMATGTGMTPRLWLAWLLIDGDRDTEMTLAMNRSDTVIPERA